MSAATKPTGEVFTFDGSATIGDLLLVVKTLTNTGQKPKLRLVRSYIGEFESVAVDVEPRARSAEMAIVSQEDNGEVLVPDPPGLPSAVDAQLRTTLDSARRRSVSLDTPVFYEGKWVEWRELAGRVPCAFNSDGELVAKPFASDPRD